MGGSVQIHRAPTQAPSISIFGRIRIAFCASVPWAWSAELRGDRGSGPWYNVEGHVGRDEHLARGGAVSSGRACPCPAVRGRVGVRRGPIQPALRRHPRRRASRGKPRGGPATDTVLPSRQAFSRSPETGLRGATYLGGEPARSPRDCPRRFVFAVKLGVNRECRGSLTRRSSVEQELHGRGGGGV